MNKPTPRTDIKVIREPDGRPYIPAGVDEEIVAANAMRTLEIQAIELIDALEKCPLWPPRVRDCFPVSDGFSIQRVEESIKTLKAFEVDNKEQI